MTRLAGNGSSFPSQNSSFSAMAPGSLSSIPIYPPSICSLTRTHIRSTATFSSPSSTLIRKITFARSPGSRLSHLRRPGIQNASGAAAWRLSPSSRHHLWLSRYTILAHSDMSARRCHIPNSRHSAIHPQQPFGRQRASDVARSVSIWRRPSSSTPIEYARPLPLYLGLRIGQPWFVMRGEGDSGCEWVERRSSGRRCWRRDWGLRAPPGAGLPCPLALQRPPYRPTTA